MTATATPIAPRRFDPVQVKALQERCLQEFERLYTTLPETRVAAISTADGRAFATRFAERGDGARTGALTSALLALCETMMKELQAGSCRNVVVAADKMNVVVVRIAHPRGQFSLALGVADSVLLAVVLRTALDCAERVKKILTELR